VTRIVNNLWISASGRTTAAAIPPRPKRPDKRRTWAFSLPAAGLFSAAVSE
jgi:hypothetical protein